MNKSKSNILPLAMALGVGGIATYYLFPQVKETLISGGGGSSAGGLSETSSENTTSANSIVDTGLTKKQVKFISSELTTPKGQETTVTTTSKNGKTRTTILTSSENIKAIESKKSFKANSGTNTAYIFKNKKGEIIGGLDFGRKISLSRSGAKKTYSERKNKVYYSPTPIRVTKSNTYQGPIRRNTDLKKFRKTGYSVPKKKKKYSSSRSFFRSLGVRF